MAILETLLLSTTPGLEPALMAEAALLGRVKLVAGGVVLEGPQGLHRRANLCLRCAERVLLQVGGFPAKDFKDLARGLRGLSLERFLRKGATTVVEVTARGELPERELYFAARSLGLGGATLRLRADARGVAVAVDTSGELLHRRGYRQEGSRAPLRETLAAGMLALAVHHPDQPLWDPLCGSGTVLVEAALRSRQIAPGLKRRFAFEQFPSHDAPAFLAEKAALSALSLPAAPTPLRGGDLNAGALGTARRNAGRAGVLADLILLRHDATVPMRDLPPGCLAIANLPYGLRVGAAEALPKLYRAIGRALRRAGAVRLAFLVHDPRAVEWLEIEGGRCLSIENGGLRCQLLLAGGATAEAVVGQGGKR